MGRSPVQKVLERLKSLREELAMRQDYVATRVGVDRTTYLRKEGGSVPITTDEWIKIAGVMGADPSYFFSACDEIRPQPELAPRERLLLRLYRSLRPAEQDDLLCAVYAKCRHIRRKAVQESLKLLRSEA
ncbi:MAG: helix-turn-helix transcriptional regulator [Deltaproteobacteria bacterium]|nr:helix-turn-helix transcriptional regulator [Deltaproteobacteria bacterium]